MTGRHRPLPADRARRLVAVVALAAAAGLGGCAIPGLGPIEPEAPQSPPRPAGTVFRIDTPFDAGQAGRMLRDGPNTVTGSASLRRPGGPVTCAGQAVYLVPATDYAQIRVRALYGSDRRGARIDGRSLRFEPDPPDYSRLVRQARCDADGRFRFERVANGRFFLTAVLRWQDGNRQASGSLMQEISAGGGRTIDVRLSR